jgi:hypothetical protein
MTHIMSSSKTCSEKTLETSISTHYLASFSVTISSGQETASQIAQITSTVVVSDQIALNGINVSTPLSEPADLNIAADGSILVGASSPIEGDEITVDALSDGTDDVFVGGDSVDSAQQVVNIPTQNFEVCDISNNTITSAASMGQVGLEWRVSGFGDFSGRAGEADMLMRNSNTGAFEVYDISSNAITLAGPMGVVGLEWTVAGFGHRHGGRRL